MAAVRRSLPNLTHLPQNRALRAGGCKGLRRLNLSSNELHAEGLRELLGAFLAGACPELSDLGLASNCLGGWVGALLLMMGSSIPTYVPPSD